MYNTILQGNDFFKLGSYLRLSKEDENKLYKRENESESIINQRSLIMNYIKDNGFAFVKEYVDDGFSGTTFDDRPAFQEMLKDIEKGKINAVITKDLSRLGRDYIQSGYYLEQYFPSRKVRYISILDNIDTFLDSANNDIAPFKSLFNDMTSKDTSKKIRSILKDKKRQGLFLGSEAPFGYMKDPYNKHHLIVDPSTAQIVRMIFDYALSGMGITDISTILNNEHIKTPHAYKNRRPTYRKININMWTNSSINKILSNRVYIGDLVQNVQSKLNYKSKKKIKLDQNLWIIVENTHEAIVTKEEFNIIQNSPNRGKKPIKEREKLLLENLVFCKECGGTLGASFNKRQNSWSLNCNKYARSPRLRLCVPHFMPYKKFEMIILERVRKVCEEYLKTIDINKILDKMPKNNYEEIKINKEKQLLKNKINELTKKLDTLYDDKFKGIISIETYIRLSISAEDEINNLKQKLEKLEGFSVRENDFKIDYEDIILKLVNINNPSRELLFQIIKKIKVDKNKVIEINYNFKS
jgi:DNA invertase Pin-like site-specific DNA recombinase